MVLDRANSFDDFLYRCTAEVVEKGMNKNILRNQVDYLTDANGKLRADVIGRFERLSEDTKIILDEFGVDYLPNVKQSREYGDWRRHYNEQTRELIGNRYQKDIEILEYTFD